MTNINDKWVNTINTLKPLLTDNDTNLLNSCKLSEENGQWYIDTPNKFALDHLKKLLDTIQLALKKQDINTVDIRIVKPDLFSYGKAKKEKKGRTFESKLNTDYQFDNFVVGQSNDNAYAAAKRISEGLFSEDFNPLLIYGGTGLGKSHLMHAAGNALVAKGHQRVLYVTAEEFTNDYISTLGNPKRSMQEFNEYYRNADALLIDDVQFLGGKDRSQAEFFHTFNSLFDKKRPIILTCDRYPKEIDGLEPRLQSRFGSGLTVSVVPPEFETRVAILRNKAIKLDFDLPDDVAQFIAHNIASNVRDLEGALRKVYAYSQFRHTSTPDQSLAREALNDHIKAQNKQITLENIRKVVAKHYDVTIADLDSPSRKASVRLPRQVAMHLARNLTQHSTTEIGQCFGGRDHSTVLNACKRIDESLKTDSNFKEKYKGLEMTITG